MLSLAPSPPPPAPTLRGSLRIFWTSTWLWSRALTLHAGLRRGTRQPPRVWRLPRPLPAGIACLGGGIRGEIERALALLVCAASFGCRCAA